MRTWTRAALGLMLGVGCGGGGGVGGSGDGGGGDNDSGGSTTISSQMLSGEIDGWPWTFGTGETNALLSTSDQYYVSLSTGTFDACAEFSNDPRVVLMMMPMVPGSYDLSLNLNATFSIPNNNTNRVATSGRLVIASVTPTTITGGMHITYDSQNTVDGQFTATICP